jgi:hypothetical protein
MWFIVAAAATTFANPTCRPILSGSSVVTDSVFLDCTSASQRGGAIYFNDNTASLDFICCRFEACRVIGDNLWGGGAFCADACLAFVLNESFGLNCSVAYSGGPGSDEGYAGFGAATVEATSQVSQTSFAFCRCRLNTAYFDSTKYDSQSTGSHIWTRGTNATGNLAVSLGSAWLFYNHWEVSVRMSVVVGNLYCNAIGVDRVNGANLFECLAVFNNTSNTTGSYQGFLGIHYSDITFANSVFQRNDVQTLVGARSAGRLVTFIHCVFDAMTLAGTTAVSASIIATEWIEMEEITALIECIGTAPRSCASTAIHATTEAFTEPWDSLLRPSVLVRMSHFVVAWMDF